MRDRFIQNVTEHDVLVTGTIKIIHRLLAVAARLLALVESLALRHHDVDTVRRVIRLNPSRSMVSAPLALIHAQDLLLVSLRVLGTSSVGQLILVVSDLLSRFRLHELRQSTSETSCLSHPSHHELRHSRSGRQIDLRQHLQHQPSLSAPENERL